MLAAHCPDLLDYNKLDTVSPLLLVYCLVSTTFIDLILHSRVLVSVPTKISNFLGCALMHLSYHRLIHSLGAHLEKVAVVDLLPIMDHIKDQSRRGGQRY